jgi:hypothetical protein
MRSARAVGRNSIHLNNPFGRLRIAWEDPDPAASDVGVLIAERGALMSSLRWRRGTTPWLDHAPEWLARALNR